jgi:hypothetical protein
MVNGSQAGLVGAALCFVLLGPSSAWAQTWNESGDAPGQITIGLGPLVTINGTIGNPDFDVDVYCIRITNPGALSATVTGAVDTANLSSSTPRAWESRTTAGTTSRSARTRATRPS